ncbi:hypothetical protein AA0119_g7397 [Alternaria tenuissima]|uniref:Uncharacterized protein n=1 Tax=Alternaria tenuissima TaxID=119927 RepID=A0ABY0G678_9PLEO|nr:hypothetical protein AA0118_g8373 [Alternaria tenuissima]RYN88539.1 hypothetical protein AA0120_g7006 [Alternaria tenuissima]RYN97519.1 hypothetical protein AA0119_g7397 [Alternaria tenuissima]RYO13238.1 hypothetical protein AA0121_g8631 [Alternaria tenuissima]
MSAELIRQADKRKLSPEQRVDIARTSRVRDECEDEQRIMAKRRVVEGRHIETSNWITFSHHEPRRDTLSESLPPAMVIPTGPKASHRAPFRSSSPINVHALLTPHNRGLSNHEVRELTVLQTRVDNAIAGIGPSLRILLNIPKSIQLNIQQKQRVYDAQKVLDMAVLESKLQGQGGSESVVKKTPSTSTSQYGGRTWYDSDGWTILTLPPLDLAESIEGSLIARSMWVETNSLLAQLKRVRVKISFSAADRETLRIDT